MKKNIVFLLVLGCSKIVVSMDDQDRRAIPADGARKEWVAGYRNNVEADRNNIENQQFAQDARLAAAQAAADQARARLAERQGCCVIS